MDKYSLVLFDLDGTLTDSHKLIFDSFNHVLRKYGSGEMTPEQILSYFGPTEEVCIKEMLGEENFESIWSDFVEYYRSHLNECVLFEGLREFLDRLKSSGRLIGVFTAKGGVTTDLTLEYHGLKSMFDIVVTGSVVKSHKPHPEGIDLALSRLNVRPENAIVVGDSPSDYKAAAAAGTDFIAVLYGHTSTDRFKTIECKKATSVPELAAYLLTIGRSEAER